MRKLFKGLLAPVFIAAFLFVLVRTSFAEIINEDINFAENLEESELQVGVESIDGYSQVYYLKGSEKIFVTEGARNSRMPHSEGEYVVWVTDINGAGQIFMHNISANATIQLTNSRTNLKPKVDKTGKVVWERWVDENEVSGWQIALFDGISYRRITSGDLSTNPDIEGDFMVFSRKGADGIWRAMGYSLREKRTTVIDVGVDSKFPELDNGEIVLNIPGKQQKAEPLKIEDLFVLDEAVDLSSSLNQEVTPEEILAEISEEPIDEEEPGE